LLQATHARSLAASVAWHAVHIFTKTALTVNTVCRHSVSRCIWFQSDCWCDSALVNDRRQTLARRGAGRSAFRRSII